MFKKLVPRAIQVAVFDSSFFVDMPKVNYLYSIDMEDYKKYHVRRYGAHGTSHRYIAQRLDSIVDGGIKDKNVIVLHLGSGASISAIKHGKAFDISIFTPYQELWWVLEVVTSTFRSCHIWWENSACLTFDMIDILNQKSGLLGISGVSADMRDIEANEDTNQRAKLALEMYATHHQIHGLPHCWNGWCWYHYFTAGVGENSAEVREDIMSGFNSWVSRSTKEQSEHGKEIKITTDDSKITATRSNQWGLMIAQDTYKFAKILMKIKN